MTDTISIPRPLANKLLTLAQHDPEAEICGLISQTSANGYHLYPVDNVASSKQCVFEMDAKQQIDAFKSMRENDESLFAIFHSHPTSEALPSPRDIDEAAYSDALNIIISLSTKGVLDMRGYFYRNDSVEPVDLEIE